jgi:hypothetical protein
VITIWWLLVLQGALGGFDTLYFHEWRARLVARGPDLYPELRLHAARSLIYGVLFAGLALFSWHGLWGIVLVGLLLAEIVITLADFTVEDWVRNSLGGVFPGERITHAIMGIVYGAMLGYLVPTLLLWIQQPTGLSPSVESRPVLKTVLLVMAAGVTLSGLRDGAATFGSRWARYPWPEVATRRL